MICESMFKFSRIHVEKRISFLKDAYSVMYAYNLNLRSYSHAYMYVNECVYSFHLVLNDIM